MVYCLLRQAELESSERVCRGAALLWSLLGKKTRCGFGKWLATGLHAFKNRVDTCVARRARIGLATPTLCTLWTDYEVP
jgi:hypothetical protein